MFEVSLHVSGCNSTMNIRWKSSRERSSDSECKLPKGGVIRTIFTWHLTSHGASLMAQAVKHLPAVQETWVPSLGREDPLEKEMATHSSILAWEIP